MKSEKQIDIENLKSSIKLKNKQTPIFYRSLFLAVLFLLLSLLAFLGIIEIQPAILFLSIFIGVSFLGIAIMFYSRSRKLAHLITGETLVASWILSQEEKQLYVNKLFNAKKQKNKAILLIVSAFVFVVFGVFLIFMEEGKLSMFMMSLMLMAIVAVFALGMPYYYRYKNSRGDGIILIGKRYAYINGYFHNWDFPLSGIEKVKIIKQPFYGLLLEYYFYDRTLKHHERLEIPAKKNINLERIIENLSQTEVVFPI